MGEDHGTTTMIYVDPLAMHGWCLRGQIVKSSHLFDDGNLEELHQFAQRLGLKRTWFQPSSTPHYDLTASIRAKAIALGAQEVDRRQAVTIWKAKSCG